LSVGKSFFISSISLLDLILHSTWPGFPLYSIAKIKSGWTAHPFYPKSVNRDYDRLVFISGKLTALLVELRRSYTVDAFDSGAVNQVSFRQTFGHGNDQYSIIRHEKKRKTVKVGRKTDLV
jgi:hypothetical protein